MAEDVKPFGLAPHQVPEPPLSDAWRDQLRWLVMVMNHDDPHLAIAASMLCQCIQKGGISEKQAVWANDILARVGERFADRGLDCQKPPAERQPGRSYLRAVDECGGDSS